MDAKITINDSTNPSINLNSNTTESTKLIRNSNDRKKSPLPKQYFCKICGQGFTRKHNMISHELIHSSLKPHVCQTCSLKFRRVHDLRRHEKVHTGEKPNVCQKCFKGFARTDALVKHQNSANACLGNKKLTENNKSKDRALIKPDPISSSPSRVPILHKTQIFGHNIIKDRYYIPPYQKPNAFTLDKNHVQSLNHPPPTNYQHFLHPANNFPHQLNIQNQLPGFVRHSVPNSLPYPVLNHSNAHSNQFPSLASNSNPGYHPNHSSNPGQIPHNVYSRPTHQIPQHYQTHHLQNLNHQVPTLPIPRAMSSTSIPSFPPGQYVPLAQLSQTNKSTTYMLPPS